MNRILRGVMLTASTAALVAGASFAQAQNSAPATTETVEVTGTRINLAGFQSPTPVQVIGAEQIQQNAQVQISDEIRDLPQVSGTVGSAQGTGLIGQGSGGIDELNIRGFGADRTLVLFDHQRVVTSDMQDDIVDLGTLPSALVSRVEVVTGGASAAWGSDAVTGVINLVINKNFQGVKANVEYSDNDRIPLPRFHTDLALGTSFDGDRGHFEIAGTWTESPLPNFTGQNLHRNGVASVYNPAYCTSVTYPVVNGVTQTTGGTCAITSGVPYLMRVYGAGTDDRIQGGIINNNTAGLAGSGLTSGALKGLMFTGANNTTVPFNYGTTYNTTCYNGCTADQYSSSSTNFGITQAPYHQDNYFSYISYQLTPDIKTSISLAHSTYAERDHGTELSTAALIVPADNAYLPASVAQAFVCKPTSTTTCAAGTTTLSNGFNPVTGLGGSVTAPTQTITVGIDYANNRLGYSPSSGLQAALPGQNPNPGVYTMANECSALGDSCNYMSRTLNRGSLQFDGSFSSDWTWSAYGEWSQVRLRQKTPNDIIRSRLAYALDAVTVTPTNVGTSGLALGSVQCRALLNGSPKVVNGFDDLTGCVPLNPFGYGNVSAAAFRYLSPGISYASTGILEQELVIMNQVAGGASVNGVLPWQLPAGPIGFAAGTEYRLEQSRVNDADPRGAVQAWNSGNFINLSSAYNVIEGFAEVAIPVLKNYVVQSVDVDLAGRVTNYSTSGVVETYKFGLNSQITDELRFRGFYSLDIRAPTNWDLFAPGGGLAATCASWAAGGSSNNCFTFTTGNQNLQPEKAHTVAAGLIYTPGGWLAGLSASVDWFDLRLHGGIASVNAGQVVSLAQQGNTAYCPLITTADGSDICSYSTAAGTKVPQIVGVHVSPVNVARQTIAGVDSSIDYRFDLFEGQAVIGFVGSYQYDYSRLLNGIYYQGAGATGGFYPGGVDFTGNINASYRIHAWTFSGEVKVAGDGVLDNGTEGQPGLTSNLTLIRYSKVNGANVPAVAGGGQGGQGYGYTNYQRASGSFNARVQYRWSTELQLYAAMDNIVPGNKNYRVGIRYTE